MSKFCGIISKDENLINKNQNNDDEKLLFKHLDALTIWLVNETEELKDDFERKWLHSVEQQNAILGNETNLEQMNQNMETLHQNMATMENEVAENDIALQSIEKSIDKYTGNRSDAELTGNCNSPRSTKYCEKMRNELFTLWNQTDVMMNTVNNLLNEINEYDVQLQKIHNPYGNISTVLNLHLNVLQRTEKNLDKLLCKAETVDQGLAEILEKLKTQECGTKTLNNKNLQPQITKFIN